MADKTQAPFVRAAMTGNMLRDINRHRQACLEEGTPRIQESLVHLEKWLAQLRVVSCPQLVESGPW